MSNDKSGWDAHIALAVVRELVDARNVSGDIRSAHEGYAVLLEHVDQLWEGVKSQRPWEIRAEAVHIAAMAIRLIVDVIDKPYAPATQAQTANGKEQLDMARFPEKQAQEHAANYGW